jgi:hypothetical protein
LASKHGRKPKVKFGNEDDAAEKIYSGRIKVFLGKRRDPYL